MLFLTTLPLFPRRSDGRRISAVEPNLLTELEAPPPGLTVQQKGTVRDMCNIQAAIFDVDGTLFDYRDRKIHDSTVEAIHRLKKQRTTIIIASGRSYPLLGVECLTKIPADYYVTANGHSIQDACARELFAYRFSIEQTERVVELTKKYGNGLLLKYGDYSYLYSSPDEMFQVFNNIGLSRDLFITCATMDHHYHELPLGFTIRGSDEIKTELAAIAHDYRVELFHDVTECDVYSPRLNKMTALRKLAAMLDLDPQRCIAFGDSRNDIEIIQWAGLGVAMGNSCQDLKDVADAICACSWEDGIARTITGLLAQQAG